MGDEYTNFEYLPESDKFHFREKLNQKLKEIQEENQNDLVVDAHLTVYNLKTGIIENIFTKNEIEFYTDVILLDSTPENVLENRKKDLTKKRILDIDLVSKELEIEKREAENICSKNNLKLHIIKVGDNEIENLKKILVKN